MRLPRSLRSRVQSPPRPGTFATRLAAAGVATVALATASLAVLVGAAPRGGEAPPATDSHSSAHVATSAVRFEAFDVVVDSGREPLHAYQVRLKASAGSHARVRLVGIEGGEASEVREVGEVGRGGEGPEGQGTAPARGAFVAPPFYDPAALQQDVVILGALATPGLDAPLGETRVARVHVMVEGAGEPPGAESLVSWDAEVMTAGRGDATRIEARVRVKPAASPERR